MKAAQKKVEQIRNADSILIASQVLNEYNGLIQNFKYDYISGCPFLVLTIKFGLSNLLEIWCCRKLETQLTDTIRKKGNRVRIAGFVCKELGDKFIGTHLID